MWTRLGGLRRMSAAAVGNKRRRGGVGRFRPDQAQGFPPQKAALTEEDVLFCDSHVLAINKPAGILSQSDRTGDTHITAMAAEYLRNRFRIMGRVHCMQVHRLDRPVSGAMVFARTGRASARLSEVFKDHAAAALEKVYYAVVVGRLEGAGVSHAMMVPQGGKGQRTRVLACSTVKASDKVPAAANPSPTATERAATADDSHTASNIHDDAVERQDGEGVSDGNGSGGALSSAPHEEAAAAAVVVDSAVDAAVDAAVDGAQQGGAAALASADSSAPQGGEAAAALTDADSAQQGEAAALNDADSAQQGEAAAALTSADSAQEGAAAAAAAAALASAGDQRSAMERSIGNPRARLCVTEWAAIHHSDRLDEGPQTVLRVQIRTGRKHQIRAQLSNLGHPIVGDIKYGAPTQLSDRTIGLHSRLLILPHPVHHSAAAGTIALDAPVPEAWVTQFGKSAVRKINGDAQVVLRGMLRAINDSRADRLKAELQSKLQHHKRADESSTVWAVPTAPPAQRSQ